MDRLITTAELKVLTGCENEAEIELQYRVALGRLYRYLGVTSLLTHTVTDEHVRTFGNCFYPRDFPAVTSGISIKTVNGDTISGYTFGRYPGNIRTVNVLDANGKPTVIGYDELLVSYVSGFTSTETITVLDYSTLNSKTITVYVNGEAVTYTFTTGTPTERQIACITSNNATATAIASALGGTASGAAVTLPVGTSVELGTATAAMLTITPATLPDAFKACLAALVSAGLAEKQTAKNIKSYSIGQKSVQYGEGSTKTYDDVLSEFVSGYRLPYFASS